MKEGLLVLLAVLFVAALAVGVDSIRGAADPPGRAPGESGARESPARVVRILGESPRIPRSPTSSAPARGLDVNPPQVQGDPADGAEQELLQSIASDMTGAWLPTEEAFIHHAIEVRVSQVEGLDLDYVRRLLVKHTPNDPYLPYLYGEGVLSDVLDMPTEEDARRLWSLPSTPRLFEAALARWHAASEMQMRRGPLPRAEDLELERVEQRAGDTAWRAIFQQPVTYDHWGIVMRLAELHFR